MKREIKFRAWDESQKHMAIQGTPDLETLQSFMFHFGEDVLMQFTGLKDVNGNEIYEGDIVKWGHKKGGEENPIRISIVKIQPDIQFHIINYKTDFSGQNNVFHYGSFIYKDTHNWLEIIGNIYQNPELLK